MLQSGDKLGAYRIVRTLGRGGMGVTYEAERASDGARVALKELHLARVEDWKALELFEREARVLANITHPAVPTYIDHFSIEHPDGTAFYLVQQLARGQSLGDRGAAGWRADEAEAKRIAASLLDVLDYLHARSQPVIHRDIKPQNVIMDDAGKVWLVDFGSVRDVYKTTSGGSTIAGTLGYMGAEQLRGVARPESDLHGLAATLLFALSGKSPADMPQVKLRIDFRPFVRVSRAFAAWLEKMLAPAPEDRFPSARLALVALRDLRAVATRAATAPASRTRTLAFGVALGVIATAACSVAFFELNGARRAPAQADTPGWTPAALSQLVLWLDASTGLSSTSGGRLIWRDRSGLGNDATAIGSPIVEAAAIAGRPSIRLNGATDYFVVGDVTSLQFATGEYVIVVVAAHTTPTEGGPWGYGLFYSKQERFAPYVGAALLANTTTRTAALSAQIALDTPSLVQTGATRFNMGQPLYLRVRRFAAPAGARLELSVNGALATATGTGTGYALDVSAAGEPLRIGGTEKAQDVRGDIAEVIALKGAIADEDLRRLDAYVNGKYGL